MRCFCKTGTASHGDLLRPIRKALKTLLQVGVLLTQSDSCGGGNDNPAQIEALEPGRKTCSGKPVEIKYTGSSTGLQQTVQLPQTLLRIGQIAQPVGHHNPVSSS